MSAGVSPFRSEFANRMLAEGRLPSVPKMATAAKVAALPPPPPGPRDWPEQWYSPNLLSAWSAVVGVLGSTAIDDRRFLLDTADQIERADIELERREGAAT